MIKRVLAIVAFVVFGLFISVGYSAIAQTPPSNTPLQPSVSPLQSNSQINPIDRQFVLDASQAGIGNIMLGQLALQRSNNADVRRFAQAEINEQTQVGNELRQIGPRIGVTPASAPGSRQQAIMARMQQLSGSDFDRAYLDEGGVNAHLENASIFQREAAFGQNQDLVRVATGGLPIINQHFTTASSLTNYRFAQVARRYNVSSVPNAPVRSAQ